jgi:Flp pilus assembly protein TadG
MQFLKALIRRSRNSRQAIAGTSAVEFALVAPLFIMLLFGTITYSSIMSIYSGVQQLVAEAARASVGGLSFTERDQLARNFVTTNLSAYPFLDPTKLTVTTATTGGTSPGFQVTLSYNTSAMFYNSLSGLLPLPVTTISRSAVVQQGGL